MRSGLFVLFAILIGAGISLAATNQVVNPGFEAGDGTSPQSWSFNAALGDLASRSALRSHTGQYSLTFERHRGDDWGGGQCPSWRTENVRRWLVAAWVWTEACSPVDHLYVRFFGEAGYVGQFGPELPANSGGWVFLYQLIEAPEGAATADFSPQIRSLAPAKVWIDDVLMCPATEVEGLDEAELKTLVASLAPQANSVLLGTEAAERYIEASQGVQLAPLVASFASGATLTLKLPASMLPAGGLLLETSGPLKLETRPGKSWIESPSKGNRVMAGKTQLSFQVPAPLDSGEVWLRLTATGPVEVYSLEFFPDGLDLDLDAIPDALESFLGANLSAAEGPFASRANPPRSSFQNPTGYMDTNDLKTDIEIVAGSDPDKIKSWQRKGYETHVMYGFRDGQAWVDAHPEDCQTTGGGTALTCGPGSYYLVPSENRVQRALEYFTEALEGGTQGVCPEEPEFFASAGYSGAFKKAFEERYGHPWSAEQTPQNRWEWEVLKGDMEVNIMSEIYKLAQDWDPSVKRFLLAHSPINYTAIGAVFPHYKLLKTGLVTEMVNQTWSDMLRGAIRYAGVSKPRIVELGYLEYSSAYALCRGLVPVWFLQDPLADAPSLTMDQYHFEYEATVIGALMRPEVSNYEVIPWPVRVFGRIPDQYDQKRLSIIRALAELQDFDGDWAWANPAGLVAVSFGDGACFQRCGPLASAMDGCYGLMLPLLYSGYAFDVAHIDRFAEPGYLAPYKVLFLSYDGQKPLEAAVNAALADWVKAGGTLVLFGAGDAFDEVDEWWKAAGFASPQDELLAQLGVEVAARDNLGTDGAVEGEYVTALESDYTGRNGDNRGWIDLELSTQIASTGQAFIKFEDTLPEDGWGAAVEQVEIWVDGQLATSFLTGSPEEAPYVAVDHGSGYNGIRFADGDRFWIYGFTFPKGTRLMVRLMIQNQYRVSVSDTEPRAVARSLVVPAGSLLTGSFDELPSSGSPRVSAYPCAEAETLLTAGQGGKAVGFHRAVGAGQLWFLGVNPALTAKTPQGAELVQRLLALSLQEQGLRAPAEADQQGLLLQRGPYTLCKQWEGQRRLSGTFINIFDPELSLLEELVLGPEEHCLLRDVSAELSAPTPTVLWITSKLNWQQADEAGLKLLVSGPANCDARARFALAGREVASVEALGADGKPRKCDFIVEGKTLLLKYIDEPAGLAIKLTWR